MEEIAKKWLQELLLLQQHLPAAAALPRRANASVLGNLTQLRRRVLPDYRREADAFAVLLTPYFDPPIMALAWGVLAGGLAQLLYQLPALKKIGMLVLPRLRPLGTYDNRAQVARLLCVKHGRQINLAQRLDPTAV